MTDVSASNFMKSRGLNRTHFKAPLDESESEYGDIVYCCKVRWLTRG